MRVVLSRPRRGERGTAMVESALVLLVLLMTTIFVIDFGRMLLMEQFITERARQTARKAVVNNWTSTQVKNYLVYGNPDTADLTAPGRLGLVPSQVTYSTLGTAGTPAHRVQVKVSGVQALLFVPKLSGTYALPTVVATVPAQSMGAAN
jgi:Flp pilus assembly protein TadG